MKKNLAMLHFADEVGTWNEMLSRESNNIVDISLAICDQVESAMRPMLSSTLMKLRKISTLC